MRGPGALLYSAKHAFFSLLFSRWMILLGLVAAFPPLLAQLIVWFGPKEPTVTQYVTMLALPVLQLAVPFPALFLGVAVLGEEIDGRTITYLFTRPLPRAVHYLARLFGFVAAYGVVLVSGVLAIAFVFRAAVPLSIGQVLGSAAIALGGLLIYASLFALLRALFRRALFIGFLITFITEVAISKMPVSGLSGCSIWHHLALLELRLLDIETTKVALFRGISPTETASGSLIVLGSILAVSLVAGIWIVQRREFRLPAAVAAG